MLYSFMAPKCLDTTHLDVFLLLIKEAEKGGMLEKYAPIEICSNIIILLIINFFVVNIYLHIKKMSMHRILNGYGHGVGIVSDSNEIISDH